MPLVTLPNGMVVETPNETEALFLYKEIFETGVYLRHGLDIGDGDCVFDVGANVGLFFPLWFSAIEIFRLVLFEPIPATYAMLERNTERLLGDARVTLVRAGVASKSGHATSSSTPSGRWPPAPARTFARSKQAFTWRGAKQAASSGTSQRLRRASDWCDPAPYRASPELRARQPSCYVRLRTSLCGLSVSSSRGGGGRTAAPSTAS